MKRTLALLLTFVLVLGLAVPAFAENGEYNENGYNENGNNYENGYDVENGYNGDNGYNGEANDYDYEYTLPAVWEMFERPFPGYGARRMFGYIGETTQADCGNYTVEILNEEGEVKLIVWKLTGIVDYAVIDAVTGLPAELEDHGGGEVLVFYGPLYTMHEIPQSNALVFAINMEGVEYGPMPHHHVIEAIEWDEAGEALLVTVDNGGVVATLDADTELQAWLTRQIVVLDEFQIGDEILLWYGPAITLSFPAYVTPTRALRLVPARPDFDDVYGYGEVPDYAEEPADEYETPGEAYEARELLGGIVRVGVNLYRVNLNAEARGYEVLWNAELRRAELISGDTIITLAPGFAVFYVNGVSHTMSAPSLLEGGRLFAPADFFEYLK